MPVVVSQDDSVYTNNATITDAPAVRITGDRVRFVNSESGRVITSDAAVAAISIEGEDAVIINQAGGIIRAADNSFDALVIVGSDGADRVENAGLIRGRVALGEGSDVFISRILTNDLATIVELGGGDDSFYLRPTSGISLTHQVDGGDGIDRFVIFEADGNVGGIGVLVKSIEILEIHVNGIVESFSGLETILVDYRTAGHISNALRFFATPDAAVSLLADGGSTNISIYDRSSIGSLTGSAFSDAVVLGSDTLVTGAIDLGAGDDVVTFFRSQFEQEIQESFGTLLDGGAGTDTLDIQLRGGDVFDAANAVNFERLWVTVTTQSPSALILRDVDGVTEVILRETISGGAPVRIEASDLSTGFIKVEPRVSVTIDAGSIVGSVSSLVPFPLDTPVADDTKSITIRNDGQILGDVKMFIGDDLFDGRLGTVGGRIYGYAGNDRIETNAGDNILDGGAGGDFLSAGIGSDTLYGGSAADVLIGGAGADAMYGGAGDDTFYVDDSGDSAVELTGEGNDRVATSIGYALAAGAEIETLEAVNSLATDAMDLQGNAFANTVIGNAGVNFLRGEGGNDTLIALGGNDFLIGGAGADLMYGGAGNDTYYVDHAGDQANEAAGEGTDRIATSIGYALASNSEVELLEAVNTADTNAMDLTGSDSANTIIGNAGVNILRGAGGNDVLIGLAGSDFLVGGTGADIMYGGTGDDTYYVDDLGDRANEVAGEGNDRIATSISYTLDGASEVELLEAVNLTATDAMDLTGSNSGQTIVGNDGVNLLFGLGGNDILVARAGNDFLVGGTGDDVMHGGTGNDTYYVDSAGDQANELAGQGNDRVATSISYTLSAEIETLEAVNSADTSAINLTGNAINNTIAGNDGANIIDGKGGNDLLIGYGGADTFAFTTALGSGNIGRIANFVSGTDKIALDDAVFTGLGLGALSANAFVIGTQAQDADDRIIFNSTNGQLFFDADGNGAGAAILFGSLIVGMANAGDFVVI